MLKKGFAKWGKSGEEELKTNIAITFKLLMREEIKLKLICYMLRVSVKNYSIYFFLREIVIKQNSRDL